MVSDHDFLNIPASFSLKGSKYSLQVEFPIELLELAMITNTIWKRNYLGEYQFSSILTIPFFSEQNCNKPSVLTHLPSKLQDNSSRKLSTLGWIKLSCHYVIMILLSPYLLLCIIAIVYMLWISQKRLGLSNHLFLLSKQLRSFFSMWEVSINQYKI